jgi:hypothetical protein
LNAQFADEESNYLVGENGLPSSTVSPLPISTISSHTRAFCADDTPHLPRALAFRPTIIDNYRPQLLHALSCPHRLVLLTTERMNTEKGKFVAVNGGHRETTRRKASISPSVLLATLQTWGFCVVKTDSYCACTENKRWKHAPGPVGSGVFELTISSAVSTVCREGERTRKKVSRKYHLEDEQTSRTLQEVQGGQAQRGTSLRSMTNRRVGQAAARAGPESYSPPPI